VPHFVAVGHILRSQPMIATVPQALASALAEPFDLVARAHPAELPQVAINAFWHARFHRDPGVRWLRELLIDTFAEG
jgi:DNA-binding transcriptional LysR family regulator